MKLEETWLGIGVKSGGHLVLIGYEGLAGYFVNLEKPSRSHNFSMSNWRMGPGLGGGVDAIVGCVFKTKNINALHGKELEDWGVNVDYGKGRLKDLRVITKMREFFQLVRLARVASSSIVANLDKIRDAMHYIYTAYDIASSSGSQVIFMEIPGLGVGLELSAFLTKGTLQIDSQSLPRPKPPDPKDWTTKGRNAP